MSILGLAIVELRTCFSVKGIELVLIEPIVFGVGEGLKVPGKAAKEASFGKQRSGLHSPPC